MSLCPQHSVSVQHTSVVYILEDELHASSEESLYVQCQNKPSDCSEGYVIASYITLCKCHKTEKSQSHPILANRFYVARHA